MAGVKAPVARGRYGAHPLPIVSEVGMARSPARWQGAFAVALLGALVALGIWWVRRAETLSPGPLTARTGDGAVRQGVRSHAELEARCAACHPPPGSSDTMGRLCLGCHDEIALQRREPQALHSRLGDTDRCPDCHFDHKGRDAEITHVFPTSFPHDAVGFALTGHGATRQGAAFECEDCHASGVTRFDTGRCVACHEDQPDFLKAHRAAWGDRCLACHDGRDRFGRGQLAHPAFPLEGMHARVGCERCHAKVSDLEGFSGLSGECVACHADEEARAHAGRMGRDCAACHSTADWTATRMEDHRFPLDHGSRAPVPCKTCHPASMRQYTCYGCHEHTPEGTWREHRGEVRARTPDEIADCVRCHPAGREEDDEGEGDDD